MQVPLPSFAYRDEQVAVNRKIIIEWPWVRYSDAGVILLEKRGKKPQNSLLFLSIKNILYIAGDYMSHTDVLVNSILQKYDRDVISFSENYESNMLMKLIKRPD